MKRLYFLSFIITYILLGCNNSTAQLNKNYILQDKDASSWIPFLKKDNYYQYVDKNLHPKINETFYNASSFTSTGFAVVNDNNLRSALINSKGQYIIPYSEAEITLKTIDDLTLAMIKIEYEKNLPIWNWDWNIMGGKIKKTEEYVRVDLFCLETQQILSQEKIPTEEDENELYVRQIDKNHYFINNNLYKVDQKKFKKIDEKIIHLLDDKRYLKSTDENNFSLIDLKNKKLNLTNVTDSKIIRTNVNGKAFIMDSINNPYRSTYKTMLLEDSKNNSFYAFPNFEKKFPNNIQNASQEQIKFLNLVTLVYSVPDTDYFILGKIDYSNWQYDWMYLDKNGNILNHIDVKDTYITEVRGYILWPNASQIIAEKYVPENWQIKTIETIYKSKDLFKIILDQGEESRTQKTGVWNKEKSTWEIEPKFHQLELLNVNKQLYSIQKERDGELIIYSNEFKKQIGSNSYQTIYNDGSVSKKENNKTIYYKIDLSTGKEYRE